jgi:hypothetical protein
MLDAGAGLRECAPARLTVQGFDAFNDWLYERVVGV